MEELTSSQVYGTGGTSLQIDDGLNEGDVVRLDIHFQADALPPPPPGGGEVRKLYIPEIVHSVIVKAAQTYIALSCDTDGAWRENYRFGFNGQQKDNEVAGVGNSLDFGARMYDSRRGQFPTPDPLANKYPGETPYGFAGGNPIYHLDNDGRRKTSYLLEMNDKTGTATLKVTTGPGLKGVWETSDFYAWHDYTEVTITHIAEDGSRKSVSGFTLDKEVKAHTYLNWEGLAQLESGDWKTKDKGDFDGYMFYDREASGEDNKFNPRGGPSSKAVDAGALLQMFRRMSTIKGEEGVGGVVGMLKYLKDGMEITNSNQQDDNHPRLFSIGGKEIDSCETCGKKGTRDELKKDGYHPAESVVPAKQQR